MFLLNLNNVWEPVTYSTGVSFVELLGEFNGKWAFHVFLHQRSSGFIAEVKC